MLRSLRIMLFCISAVVGCILFAISLPNHGGIVFSMHGNYEKKHIMAEQPYINVIKEKSNMNKTWIQLQEEIQRNRLTTLQTGCRDLLLKSKKVQVKAIGMAIKHAYIDSIHKLLYCKVAKIASSSWVHIFLMSTGKLDSISRNQHYLNEFGKTVLQTFNDFNRTERNIILRNYTKFLFVRHPFSRVLSVFKNKLDPNTNFKRATDWQKKTGMKIIKRYRKDNKFKFKNYDLTFQEFVKYIGDPKVLPINEHWDEIYSTCHPCAVPYDFIGKMETLSEDTDYLMKISKLDEEFKFPSSSLSSPTNSSDWKTMNSYYKDIPVQDLKNLYNRFKLDFKLFGYPEPDYVNRKIIQS